MQDQEYRAYKGIVIFYNLFYVLYDNAHMVLQTVEHQCSNAYNKVTEQDGLFYLDPSFLSSIQPTFSFFHYAS